MYRAKIIKYILLVSTLLLLVLFIFWKNYVFDVEVMCEVASNDVENKIQIVSYSVRPMLSLGPHIGGTSRYDAILSINGKSKIYLLDETYIESYQRQRLCRMSLIENNYQIIHPVVNVYNRSQLSKKIKLLKKVGEGNTIIFNGKQWYYTKIELNDNEDAKRYYLGYDKLSLWVTTEIKKYNNSLIAVQVAGLQSVVEKLEDRSYMPYSAYTILDMYAYNEKVDFGDHGKFPELKPVVQRRLVSNDFGLSWKQLDWKVLDEQRVEAGSKLKKQK